jgi:hypothetical protein
LPRQPEHEDYILVTVSSSVLFLIKKNCTPS